MHVGSNKHDMYNTLQKEYRMEVPPPPPPPPPICMAIGYVPRERPPFPALNFRSGALSFSQITKKSVPEHHHFTCFGGFCRSGDHHFQNFFNFNLFIASHGRRQRRGLAAGQSASQTRPGSSGDSHFDAQNGSGSLWSPAFSSSKRLKLVPEPRIFTLDRELVPEPWPIFHFCGRGTYLPKFGVSTPPPPGNKSHKTHE